jgi:two-component system, chemotaxis family, chemotaxis protein CheV
MSGWMEGVDLRTRLVGHNRLELLLFQLSGKQTYGINVFKVREVIRCPPLTKIPNAHRLVRGVATLRGVTMAIIDLGGAIGSPPMPDPESSFVIVTEFNRQVQGFLVQRVDRIVNMNWEAVLPPPKGIGKQNYMTAVTHIAEELVEIIDVEKILADVTGLAWEISSEIMNEAESLREGPARVFVVDDSSVARRQIMGTLDKIGLSYEVACNGKEALERLQALAQESDTPMSQRFAMVISDVEMPAMDGYSLTRAIKTDPRLKDLYVLLHTSLSGVFNKTMVNKVGADEFLAKFRSEDLARVVTERAQALACATAEKAAAL